MTNVLVVSTISYKRVEALLDILADRFHDKRFEFYIINETFDAKPPENPKYNNYVSINDSSDEKDIDAALSHARSWPNFEHSIQTDEYAVTLLAILNDHLKLEGLTIEQAHRFRDKVPMKQYLSQNICKPKLYTRQDILDNLIEYPVIVKPRTFAASRGVCIAKSKGELLHNIKGKNIDYSRPAKDTVEDVEVEEYIDSDVYHIDGLVFNGNIVFCTTSRYVESCFGYAQGKIFGSISVPKLQQEQALDFAQKVHSDLRIPDGAFHLECFFKNQKFIFLEIGIRPGGAEIVPAIEAATGINLSEEHLVCQLGMKPTFEAHTQKHFGWLNYPYIYNCDSTKYVKKIVLPITTPASLYYSMVPKVGEKASSKFVNYDNSLGKFIFISDNREVLEKDMLAYANEYKVEVE